VTRHPVTTHDRPDAAPRGHVGWIVAASLTTGLIVGLLLVVAPFIEPDERDVTGALLAGFAVGWGMLALLSERLSDQPQRWALAPAAFMGVAGLLLIVFGSTVHDVLDWVWPPALLALVVWMFVSARRRLRSRSRRWLLYPVFAMLAIASVGGAYETVRDAVDADATPMPGQLIDVGGHKLHLSCTGSGSPTVVMQPGAGGSSSDFGWIAPVVARDTRVCVYDRAGRGWSEWADGTQDGARIATDLRTLLHRGNVSGPYVMAGHSFGGLYTLTFAARYPDEVAGMVLVDSTAPASGAASPEDDPSSSDILKRASALLSSCARLGLGRLVGLSGGTTANAMAMRSTIDEYAQTSESVSEAASLTDFADKPLVVLTAGEGNDDDWQAKQDELATLSTTSAHRVVSGATHPSLIFDKQDAAETTQAILDVVAAVGGSAKVQ
jgi:pimeloyl-ACP methyl ester carboxylesterase